MPDQDLQRTRRALALSVVETGVRIRRYTLDDAKKRHDQEHLDALNYAWKEWMDVRQRFYAMSETASEQDVRAVEHDLLGVDRKVDLIQRDLVSAESFRAGTRTAVGLVVALVALFFVYLATHGVRGLDFSGFAPLAEWGPLKYVEVAFWSEFGVLCWLLFLCAQYVSRRDFDRWYQPWYVATALRAPFMTVVVMMVVLEFTEWYAEGTWLAPYLLEEGNKFYFIVFMSFCLGLMSDELSAITRDLAHGVIEFVRSAVQRVTQKLKSGVMPDPLSR